MRVSLEDPAQDARVNVLGGLELVAACRRAGVRRFVFASSGGTVYGEQETFPCDEDHPKRPTSPYGVAKYAFELYLEAFGRAGDLDPVILRYANVYGPRQWPKGEAGIVAILAEHLLAGERPRIFGDGEQTRDYVHVSDVVAANRAAYSTARLGAYNVGTGVETSVNELYRMVARELGSPIEAAHSDAVAGELRRNSLDAARIARELGVRIATPLEEGLRSTLAWYRARASSMSLPELWAGLPEPFAPALDPLRPWELLGAPLDAALAALPSQAIEIALDPRVVVAGDRIAIGRGTRIAPGATIEGPIRIGRDCEIRSGAYLRGGCWLEDDCVVGANVEVKRAIFLAGAKAPAPLLRRRLGARPRGQPGRRHDPVELPPRRRRDRHSGR